MDLSAPAGERWVRTPRDAEATVTESIHRHEGPGDVMRAQPSQRSRRLPRVIRPARGLLAAVVLVLVGVLPACSAPTGGAESSADTSPTSSAGSSPAPSSPAPAAQVTPAPTGPASGLSVRVDGNKLVDGAGRPVVLRGVNVSGTEFACMQGGDQHSRGWSITGDQPLTDVATYAGVAAWGANVVRVPLNELCWLGLNGVNPKFGGDAYRQVIHAQVDAIHAAGLYAVLDLHWSAPGNYAAVAQQPMADADHSVDFWKSVAGEFRDDPAVLFDLFNEPYMYWTAPGSPDQWTCWLYGCELTQFVSAGQTGPDGQGDRLHHRADLALGGHAGSRRCRPRDRRQASAHREGSRLGERPVRLEGVPTQGPAAATRGRLAQLPRSAVWRT